MKRAIVSEDGSVWLETTPVGAQMRRWSVVDSLGHRVAEVMVPRSFDLRYTTSTNAWAVTTDSMDVPAIVKLRIAK